MATHYSACSRLTYLVGIKFSQHHTACQLQVTSDAKGLILAVMTNYFLGVNTCDIPTFSFFLNSTSLVGLSLPIVEVSRSHSN
jgi:hypothetical protein